MNCPSCGQPMRFGYITGNSVLRIVPETGLPKQTEKHTAQFTKEEFRQAKLSGWPLDVPYAGMAPWISANYCLPCKKVICQMDIADLREEETP